MTVFPILPMLCRFVHGNEKVLHCDQCQYKTSLRNNLNKHIKGVHQKVKDVKDIKCLHCNYTTAYKQDMRKHAILKHGETEKARTLTTFTCDQCEFETHLKNKLTKHIMTVHQAMSDWKCSKSNCNYVTAYPNKLKLHMKTKHSEEHQKKSDDTMKESHANTNCDYKNCAMDEFCKHINRQSSLRIKCFKCADCLFVTESPKVLKEHIQEKHKNHKETNNETDLEEGEVSSRSAHYDFHEHCNSESTTESSNPSKLALAVEHKKSVNEMMNHIQQSQEIFDLDTVSKEIEEPSKLDASHNDAINEIIDDVSDNFSTHDQVPDDKMSHEQYLTSSSTNTTTNDIIDDQSLVLLTDTLSDENINFVVSDKETPEDSMSLDSGITKLSKMSTRRDSLKPSNDQSTIYKCKNCDFQSEKRTALDWHFRLYHMGKKLMCEKCGFKAFSTSVMKQHNKSVHEKLKDFACKSCDFKSSYKRSLTQHIRFVK